MKYRLFFFCLLSLFTLWGCNKNKITLDFISPKEYQEFAINEPIDVKISSTTEKGRILQVVLKVDTLICKSLTEPPYEYTILPHTFPKEDHYYPISILAYSSEGVQEGNGLYIKIK